MRAAVAASSLCDEVINCPYKASKTGSNISEFPLSSWSNAAIRAPGTWVHSTLLLYFLCSFCLKALHSRPPCAKLCWLRIKVKAVLSSWVNGLSAPQNGKSGWGNPFMLKNDFYKKAQIFDLKKQAKSLILAPESSFLHRFEYSYAVGNYWQK